MRAVRNSPRGAHAASRAALPAVCTARARHGRLLPGPLPALLIGLVGGGLALAAIPISPGESVTALRAQSAVAPTALTLDESQERRQWRASRSRTPEAEAAPAPGTGDAVSSRPPGSPAPVLPGCGGKAHDLRRYANGRLPDRVLCALPGASDEKLRADAAVAFARLAGAYEEALGQPMCVTDGYRTLAEQRALRRMKPGLAAQPGTSEHGWGLALDLSCGVQSFRTTQHAWVARNASRFGWILPQWARRSGSKPEPWHWEFVGSR